MEYHNQSLRITGPLRILIYPWPALFIVAILFPANLSAYRPARWSPLDVYVLKDLPGGPKMIRLRVGNRVTHAARLFYNARGRLLREVYADGDSRNSGERLYSYDQGRLQSEILKDGEGQIVERRKFKYDKNGLSAMIVVDAAGRTIFRQEIKSHGLLIQSGRETVNGKSDYFKITYERERPLTIQVLNEDRREIGRIKFQYHADGRVALREREQPAGKYRCVYKYDKSNRLQSFSYFHFVGSNWVLEKTLELSY